MQSHPSTRRSPRLPSLSGVATFGLAFCVLTGCGGGPRVFNTSGETYPGPPLSIQSKPPQHVVVMNSPTPGWTLSYDATRAQFDHTDVFLTIIRPNPAFVHSQAPVTQEAGTEVPVATSIIVYARVLPHDKLPDDQPYSRAVSSGVPNSSKPPQ